MSTGIQWCDETWNPVTGCTKVSAGCKNCYAERMAPRLAGRFGYPADDPFRVTLHPEKLDEPLHWRKPRRIFVNSMSDLFHDDVPDEFILQVFGVMAACERHTFMILTKRPEGMWDFCIRKPWFGQRFRLGRGRKVLLDHTISHSILPNIWLGVSVEDQATADERIPLLLQTPAAVRFVSYEPALGPVDFTKIGKWRDEDLSALEEIVGHIERPHLDWLIFGGESGPNCRPCDLQWARDARDQCKAAGVPFFMKQVGGVHPKKNPIPDDLMIRELPKLAWMPGGSGA